MERNFRLYLTGTLIVFALLISLIIGFIDYQKGQKQIMNNHTEKIDMIGDSVVQSLNTIDQIYSLTEEKSARELEEHLHRLVKEYKKNPALDQWDYEEIQNQIGMDIYIIDETNTIIHSSFEEDIGLNFAECCGSFTDVITQRRLSGEFKHDSIDIQQSTGQVMKFGYLPTHDQKYLFELSMSLEEDEVFQNFNFLETIDWLKKEYEPIHSIRIYNPYGIVLRNTEEDEEVCTVSSEMKSIFDAARDEHEQREVSVIEDGSKITYRYIPYVAGVDSDYPMKRVLEIVYNEVQLESLLQFYRNEFLIQQLVIVLAVILLAIILGRLVSKPVYLAFHDNLTNMKNRASFEMTIQKLLEGKNQKTALMMIDIDNFKCVNDQLGHAEGDRLLISIAKLIEKNIDGKYLTARLGGDEFVVVFSGIDQKEIEQYAATLINNLNRAYVDLNEKHDLDVSISVGIAMAKKDEKLDALYERADAALYYAKEHGKNQYYFDEES